MAWYWIQSVEDLDGRLIEQRQLITMIMAQIVVDFLINGVAKVENVVFVVIPIKPPDQECMSSVDYSEFLAWL